MRSISRAPCCNEDNLHEYASSVYEYGQVTSIDLIRKAGKDYFYPIRLSVLTEPQFFEMNIMSKNNERRKLREDWWYNRIYFYVDIPDYVREDIKNGKCKLLLDQSVEGYIDIDWDYICKLFRVEKDQIVWVTSVYKPELIPNDGIVDIQYVNWWERHVARMYINGAGNNIDEELKHQFELIHKKEDRKYYNTFYNRRPRHHRYMATIALHHEDLLDDMLWSFGTNRGDTNFKHERDRYEAVFARDLGNEYLPAIKEVLDWNDVYCDPSLGTEDLRINYAHSVNFTHVNNTYYQFINETYASNGENLFYSEKSFKPFLCMQPFITYADPGTVQGLREHGYDVFDKWIDHSYDKIQYSPDRLKAVMKEIKRLNSIPKSEWNDMLVEMIPVFKHNLQNLACAYDRFSPE